MGKSSELGEGERERERDRAPPRGSAKDCLVRKRQRDPMRRTGLNTARDQDWEEEVQSGEGKRGSDRTRGEYFREHEASG